MTTATQIQLGETDRVALVFLDGDHALATPSQVTITIEDPDKQITTVVRPDALITLSKQWPLAVREDAARKLTRYGISAADLAGGTGCVEYLHTPAVAGGYYKYKGVSAEGGAAEAKTYVHVHVDFA